MTLPIPVMAILESPEECPGPGKCDHSMTGSQCDTCGRCEVCEYADEHGCWPSQMLTKGITHCRDCHVSWSGKARAHCVTCHQTFSTNGTAAQHWVSPQPRQSKQHRHPSTVSALKLGDDGIWRGAEERPFALRGFGADERGEQTVETGTGSSGGQASLQRGVGVAQ